MILRTFMNFICLYNIQRLYEEHRLIHFGIEGDDSSAETRSTDVEPRQTEINPLDRESIARRRVDREERERWERECESMDDDKLISRLADLHIREGQIVVSVRKMDPNKYSEHLSVMQAKLTLIRQRLQGARNVLQDRRGYSSMSREQRLKVIEELEGKIARATRSLGNTDQDKYPDHWVKMKKNLARLEEEAIIARNTDEHD